MQKTNKLAYVIAISATFFVVLLIQNFIHSVYFFNNKEVNKYNFPSSYIVLKNPQQKSSTNFDFSNYDDITIIAENQRNIGLYDPKGTYLFAAIQSDGKYFSKSDYVEKKRKIMLVEQGDKKPNGFESLGRIDIFSKIDYIYNLSTFPYSINYVYLYGNDKNKVADTLIKNGFQLQSFQYVSLFETSFKFLTQPLNEKTRYLVLILFSVFFTTFITSFLYLKTLSNYIKIHMYHGATSQKIFKTEILQVYSFSFISCTLLFLIYREINADFFLFFNLLNLVELIVVVLGLNFIWMYYHYRKEVKKYV